MTRCQQGRQCVRYVTQLAILNCTPWGTHNVITVFIFIGNVHLIVTQRRKEP